MQTLPCRILVITTSAAMGIIYVLITIVLLLNEHNEASVYRYLFIVLLVGFRRTETVQSTHNRALLYSIPIWLLFNWAWGRFRYLRQRSSCRAWHALSHKQSALPCLCYLAVGSRCKIAKNFTFSCPNTDFPSTVREDRTQPIHSVRLLHGLYLHIRARLSARDQKPTHRRDC